MSHTKPIDLGRKLFEDLGKLKPIGPDDKHYPDLHLPDVDDERLLDLPTDGVAEIHYHIVSRSHREEDGRNGEKKKRRSCSITMEIHAIEPGHDPKFSGGKKGNWVDGARDSFKKNFK
jgi:hypothetical protein